MSFPQVTAGGLLSASQSRRQVFRLAVPVLVEQFLLYLVGFSDTLITGRYLSERHLAAVTVGGYLFWTFASLMTLVSVGAGAIVARLIGANQREEAERIFRQVMVLSAALGTLVGVVAWTSAPWAARAMNLKGESVEHAAEFIRIVLSVFPLIAATAGGVACLRGAGDTRTGMWIMILVNLINITMTWTLAKGLGPFPELGFRGVALGTAIAEAVGGIVLLGVLLKGRSGLRLGLRGMLPRPGPVRRILRVSIPAAGESLTNSLSQLWFLSLINRLGDVSTAAHGVAIRCEAIAFLSVAAFAVPASTLTGQYLGAKRPDLAARTTLVALKYGAGLMAILGAVLFVWAEFVFDLFLGGRQPSVAAEGVPVLRIVTFALPALSVITILTGALRGAGDTARPWVIVVIGYLVVRLPLTYILALPPESGGLGWGLKGAWIAMFADLHVRAGLIAWRYARGAWKRIEV